MNVNYYDVKNISIIVSINKDGDVAVGNGDENDNDDFEQHEV